MQNSNAVVKKIYCIVINGKIQEKLDFDSVEANNRVEAEEKAKEYVDKHQADKFFECSTNRVFKIIPKVEGDEK